MSQLKNTVLFSEAEKLSMPKAFTTLVKPIGSKCNLRCDYCYYLDKSLMYENRQPIMSDDLLREYIKQYIDANEVETITFCWHGGEPLLAPLKFYEKAIYYQRKYANGKRIENTIQTNGLLVNEDWSRFFNYNNFLVGISLDGPEYIHDAYRKDIKGAGTFRKVMSTIDKFHRYRVEFNTLSVVNDLSHGNGVEVYNFFKSIGSRFMQFLPAVEFISTSGIESLGGRGKILSPLESNEGNVSSWSVDPLQFGKFLCDIYDEWVKRDVGSYFVQMFDSTLANWMGMEPGVCSLAKNCGSGLAVEHNGDVYSCDHFVYPDNLLGNISRTDLKKLYNSATQFEFGVSKRSDLPQSCMKCQFYFACTGGCPKHRFNRKEDGTRVSYLCEGYKFFFNHVKDDMELMSSFLRSGVSPQKIMDTKR